MTRPPPDPPPPVLPSGNPSGERRRRPAWPPRPSPAQLIALSFAAAILAGGLLLWLPVMHGLNPDGTRISVTFLQALFTATSALCLTGLNVLDPATDFSRLGQAVILLLIQLGGLGIVIFGTSFALLSRRQVQYRGGIRLAQQASAPGAGAIRPLIRTIVLYTATAELVGAALMLPAFVAREGWGRGLPYALFHSVSAFNNAGFTLYSGNLRGFTGDPLVSGVVALLVILGGMGFLVQLNVVGHLRHPRQHRLMVNSKLVLSMMAALLAFGTLACLALEWSNPRTLGPLPLWDKLLASFFHSVTTRTAGFSTLETGALGVPMLFVSILLMFVGASPGGTGGGTKTSTLSVMLASAWSLVRGRRDITVFRRRLDTETVLRAMTVGLLSTVLVGVMLMALLLLNTRKDVPFLALVFETVSAFGNVGLSLHLTPLLNPGQDVILIMLMFLGRIGPLTLALAVGRRQEPELVRYPADRDIVIG